MEDHPSEIHRDHRAFIGGHAGFWDSIADLQLQFMKSRGLTPQSKFIDVACGSLRGGSRFIPFLDPGCYHGIDKYIEGIIYGIGKEIGIDVYHAKMPRFAISDSFEFHKLGINFEFGIAQSLFSHLNAADIFTCLKNLRQSAAPSCQFYATFFETATPQPNPAQSNSQRRFDYTRDQLAMLGTLAGWSPSYIGDFGHPRGQMIMQFTPQQAARADDQPTAYRDLRRNAGTLRRPRGAWRQRG